MRSGAGGQEGAAGAGRSQPTRRDLTGWLLRELGGDPGTTDVPVEVVVRVHDDDDRRTLDLAGDQTERGVVRMERHEVSDVLGDDGLFTHLRTSEQLWVGKRDEAVVFFDCLDVVPSLPELLGENRREHLVQE